MAIPTNYTNNTFADYLQFEVLLDTADELTWRDLTQEVPVKKSDLDTRRIENYGDYDPNPTIGGDEYPAVLSPYGDREYLILQGDAEIILDTLSSGTTYNLQTPSLYIIPTGTVMSRLASGGEIVASPTPEVIVPGATYIKVLESAVTTAPVAIGGTQITFATNPSSPLNTWWFYNSEDLYPEPVYTRVYNPIYQRITDSTLSFLHKSDITSITGVDGLRKLRLYGRREAWKFAMQALAADYQYLTFGGGGSNRVGVYQHCVEAYEYENSRVIAEYGDFENLIGQPILTTRGSRIKVRW